MRSIFKTLKVLKTDLFIKLNYSKCKKDNKKIIIKK